jgi:hypothetical protein
LVALPALRGPVPAFIERSSVKLRSARGAWNEGNAK